MNERAAWVGAGVGFLAGLAAFVVLYRAARPAIISAVGDQVRDGAPALIDTIPEYARPVVRPVATQVVAFLADRVEAGLEEKLP